MKEYLITVTSENIKNYMIDASSNEEAISTALDFFMEDNDNLNNEQNEMINIKININSIGNL